MLANAQVWNRTPDEAAARSAGCLSCHRGIEDIHNGAVILGCTDCHGGDPAAFGPDPAAKRRAHVQPRFPGEWKTSANPVRSYALLNRENPEFVRFINPGDLRAAPKACGAGGCHATEVHRVERSMMATGAMLWGAALYNNGSYPMKNYRFGESYGPDGVARRLEASGPVNLADTMAKGILPFLDPLPRWEITQMGNILRTFERGGRRAAEPGLPNPDDQPGRPGLNLLSARGLGTNLRTDPVFLGLQKTRLLDPMLSFLGTNDHPGDYRSSGCSACHVIYANDRDPYHSGPYARFGNGGRGHSADPTIPKGESGHPIRHQFTRAIPSSQCVVCHMHPGTLVLSSYYGVTWWDLETHGDKLYPGKAKRITEREKEAIQVRNPEGSALRGNWGDPAFLDQLDTINDSADKTQFADFKGHGWIFRSVFKQDRKGTLLDASGDPVKNVTPGLLRRSIREPAQSGVPVHLKDIHLERGMHCADCHFRNDVHGNGNLYGEPRNAIEIDCIDCHGTIERRADPTSLNARTSSAAGRNPMLDYRRIFPVNPADLSAPLVARDRFFRRDGLLYQRSAVDGRVFELVQVADTVTPGNRRYNEKARLAKTIRKSGAGWGDARAADAELAHANSRMTCYACHTSWTPSCFGCHLKQQANAQRPMLHNEGGPDSRNWTSYNFQTLRDDVFLLGIDGSVTGRRVAPVRSACAVMVSSQNANREWLYSQQQTVSAEGYSGTAFSSHFPHSVRTRETRGCTDCHLSRTGDNNACMAMTLMQGTNFYNFLGRFVYVAEGSKGLEAVAATEQDEPQAVIGSSLHRIAYPDEYRAHQQRGSRLSEAHGHGPGPGDEVLALQLRGEYLYSANGAGGFRVYDVAGIANKGFSQRITTAPLSRLGQRLHVPTRYATWVASPSTLAVDPTRNHRPENEEARNRDDKQGIHPMYAFLYVTDRHEGLVVIGNPKTGVATLLDGNPANNFLERGAAWNAGGVLDGANHISIAGTAAYITSDRGLAVVSLDSPLKPSLLAHIGFRGARCVEVQFRYAFVCDEDGVKVVDVTDPAKPRLVSGAVVPLAEARKLYLVRTRAYVAAGKQGLVILDIERPERPVLAHKNIGAVPKRCSPVLCDPLPD